MVLGPSCERFDGWLSSDSKNNLSPCFSGQRDKAVCVCVFVSEGRERELLFTTPGCGDAAWGYSGRRATPDWGAPVKRVEVN